MPPALALPGPVRLALLRLAAASPAAEVGALLAAAPGSAAIVEVAPVANIAADPRWAFVLDRRGVADALVRVLAAGLTLRAIFHSHLVGPATPSREDRRLFGDFPGVALVITARSRRPPSLVAWRDGLRGPQPLATWRVPLEEVPGWP